jgi:hypothetical protein
VCVAESGAYTGICGANSRVSFSTRPLQKSTAAPPPSCQASIVNRVIAEPLIPPGRLNGPEVDAKTCGHAQYSRFSGTHSSWSATSLAGIDGENI